MTSATTGVGKRWITDFLLLSAIWGGSFLLMVLAVGDFGAFGTSFMRVAIAAAVLVPLVWIRGMGPDLVRHWKPVLLVGVLNSGVPFACYAFALAAISTGLSAILNATAPLFGAVIAWGWLGERMTRSRMLGLAIGFAGVAMLAWDKASFQPDAAGHSSGWAIMACMLATLCYGIAASFTARYLKGVPSLVNAAGSQIGAALGMLVPALWFLPTHMPSITAWLAILAAGVLVTAYAYVLYFRLIQNIGPQRTMTVTFAVPVFAILYGFVFLGEQLTGWMVLSGAVVLAGTGLATGLVKIGLLERRGG